MKASAILERIRKNKFAYAYVCFMLIELAVVNLLSDIPPTTSNWLAKASELVNFNFPSDNFYGPGAAILMIPFTMVPNISILANFLYLALGSFGYWKITALMSNIKARFLARLALPMNLYLIWLINSSQDTVFEFFLLTWSCFFLVTNRRNGFVLFSYLLCLTRAGYWIFFLGTSFLIFFRGYLNGRKFEPKKLIAVPLLIFTSAANFYIYSSPTPALEGGLTAYFSYTKYHYLSLPKMDMDVFLSGPDGAFSPINGPVIPEGSTMAETNSIYQRAAIDSIFANRKETILGWMQKFDSYVFDVQKVPHLPGSYVLSQSDKTITIQNDRLSWSLVVGNLIYMLWRTVFLIASLVSVGLFLGVSLFKKDFFGERMNLLKLAAPYVFGLVPGLLFYTETRFKIVSELLLVPLIIEIFTISFLTTSSKKI